MNPCFRSLLLLFTLLSSGIPLMAQTLELSAPETAGISGLRVLWDEQVPLAADGATKVESWGNFGEEASAQWFPGTRDGGPGALAFDAVHRSLLVRFPEAAEKIAAELAQGKSIGKVEVVLRYKSVELLPQGYADPACMSFLGRQWADNPPRWHALRRK